MDWYHHLLNFHIWSEAIDWIPLSSLAWGGSSWGKGLLPLWMWLLPSLLLSPLPGSGFPWETAPEIGSAIRRHQPVVWLLPSVQGILSTSLTLTRKIYISLSERCYLETFSPEFLRNISGKGVRVEGDYYLLASTYKLKSLPIHTSLWQPLNKYLPSSPEVRPGIGPKYHCLGGRLTSSKSPIIFTQVYCLSFEVAASWLSKRMSRKMPLLPYLLKLKSPPMPKQGFLGKCTILCLLGHSYAPSRPNQSCLIAEA